MRSLPPVPGSVRLMLGETSTSMTIWRASGSGWIQAPGVCGRASARKKAEKASA